MRYACHHCGKNAERPAGHVNRQRALGMKLYCGQRCMGLARRKNKSGAQKKAEKRAYDMEYRRENLERIRAKKADHFRRTYDPVAAAKVRKKRIHLHVEYCRRPEYKRWKSAYDRRRRAGEYGPFGDVWLLLGDIRQEISTRMTGYEIKRQNGTFGKKQARAREEAAKATRDRPRSAYGGES